MSLESILSEGVIQAVSELYGQTISPDIIQFQKTKKEFEGDITLVVFPFVKLARKSPEQTGEEIGAFLKSRFESIEKYNIIKGFVNFSITPAYWLGQLDEMHHQPEFGIVAAKADADLMMIEYSSPNTNKPLHLGHIRNNLLGFSIAEIQKANGWQVVKTNIVNDRGIHICKSMLAWKLFGNGETPESTGMKGDHLVGKYYVEFDKAYKAEIKMLMDNGKSEEEAKKEAPLIIQAQEMLLKWEQGDEEIRSL